MSCVPIIASYSLKNTVICIYVCTFQKESSRGRHRDKEDIKITKERTPESEEENVEWETNRDGEFKNIADLISS